MAGQTVKGNIVGYVELVQISPYERQTHQEKQHLVPSDHLLGPLHLKSAFLDPIRSFPIGKGPT